MSGESYTLVTLADVIDLARKLPGERREVLFREVNQALRYSAAYADLLAACGAEGTFEPLVWTDDDLGEGVVSAVTDDGEEVLRLEVGPAPSPDSPRTETGEP